MKFRLLNFPISINPFFFLVIALIGTGWYNNLIQLVLWVFAATSAVIIHELGHALWARWYGATPKIELNSFGGLCSWQNTTQFSEKQSLIVSLAGPLTGLVLGIISGILLFIAHKAQIHLLATVATYMVYVNIFWSIFNLLPVLPLDGGQAMRSIIKMFKGSFEEKLPLQISFYICLALCALAFILKLGLFMILFFAYFAFSNHKQLKFLEQNKHWV